VRRTALGSLELIVKRTMLLVNIKNYTDHPLYNIMLKQQCDQYNTSLTPLQKRKTQEVLPASSNKCYIKAWKDCLKNKIK